MEESKSPLTIDSVRSTTPPSNSNGAIIPSKYWEAEQKRGKGAELLLRESLARFTLYPIEHTEVFDMYKKAQASFWTAEEVDLEEDKRDWIRLTF